MMALMKNLWSLYYVTIKESPRNPLSAEMYSIRGQVLFLLTDDPRRVLAQRTQYTVLCIALHVPTDILQYLWSKSEGPGGTVLKGFLWKT